MKTLGVTFLSVLIIGLIIWLSMMIFTKPTFTNQPGGKLRKNWNEGGQIAFFYMLTGVVVASIGNKINSFVKFFRKIKI